MTDDATRETEASRLDAMFEPLFYRFLEMEKEFAAFALDVVGASDADIAAYAEMFRASDPHSRAFVALLGGVGAERVLRRCHAAYELFITMNGPLADGGVPASVVMATWNATTKGQT